jgi:hypothetical protein
MEIRASTWVEATREDAVDVESRDITLLTVPRDTETGKVEVKEDLFDLKDGHRRRIIETRFVSCARRRDIFGSKRPGKNGEQVNLAKTKKSGYEMSFMGSDGLDLGICQSTGPSEEADCARVWCTGVDDKEDIDSLEREELAGVSGGSILVTFFDTFETFDDSETEEEMILEWQEEAQKTIGKEGQAVMGHLLNSNCD